VALDASRESSGSGPPEVSAAPEAAGAEVYSHSRLASFEDCPRKFQYRYVWKLPAESESIEGFVGKRVHEILERLHRAADAGHLPSLPKVLWRYRQLFEEAFDPARVRIVREGTPLRFYVELGEQCIANYYRGHYPFDRDETLALEERVVFDLDAPDDPQPAGAARGRYRMQGFVDRIARARDGALEIHDFKTSARLPSQERIDEDRQLALYQLGVARRFAAGADADGGERPVRLVWHYLRHTRTLVSTRSPEALEALRRDTRALIDRIRAERVFAPKTGPLCRWCEYREGCPASPVRRPELPEYAPPRAAVARAPRRGRRPTSTPASAQLAFAFARS